MAKCRWCDKEGLDEAANACGSCLLKSLDEVESSEDGDTNPEGVKINFDMSGLGDKDKVSKTKGKRAGELRQTLFLNSLKQEQPNSNQEILMKKVKVHSNSIRGKVFVVGDGLVLNFDENGDASCNASDLPRLKAFSRHRPGRFVVVGEPKKASPAPAPKKVEVKAAKKEESKSKDEPDNTRRAPKKKAPKKSFFGKKSEE
jgi:hypothetical protein